MKLKVRDLKALIFETVQNHVIMLESFKDKLNKAFVKHIKDNNDIELEKLIPQIIQFKDKNQFKKLLHPELLNYEYTYRLIEFKNEKDLEKILNIKKVSKVIETKSKGIITSFPTENSLSSWTINPRSLVYSGFLSVVKGKPNFNSSKNRSPK